MDDSTESEFRVRAV